MTESWVARFIKVRCAVLPFMRAFLVGLADVGALSTDLNVQICRKRTIHLWLVIRTFKSADNAHSRLLACEFMGLWEALHAAAWTALSGMSAGKRNKAKAPRIVICRFIRIEAKVGAWTSY